MLRGRQARWGGEERKEPPTPPRLGLQRSESLSPKWDVRLAERTGGPGSGGLELSGGAGRTPG